MLSVIALILWILFISPVLLLLYGRYIGLCGTAILGIGNIFCVHCLSLVLVFYYYNSSCPLTFFIVDWFVFDLVYIQFSFIVDSLSIVMVFLILFISFLIHIYSYEYLGSDPHLVRFYGYLGLFTFFMVFLVLSYNFFQIFLAWECVGVFSYLLITFWYFRYQAVKSSVLAIVVNKIGDIFFLIAGCCLMSALNSSNIGFLKDCILFVYGLFGIDCDTTTLWELDTFITRFILELSISSIYSGFILCTAELFCILLLIACAAKSAQFILFIWLPEAMEGPTPVSALLHSATMVTLGIFMILRISDIFAISSSLPVVLVLLGCSTIIIVSVMCIVNNDLKKIIAFSTCSQLGYLFIGCGCSEYVEVLYQLLMHAFFKSMLFLCAGYLIYVSSSDQDIRFLGGLAALLPCIYLIFFCGTICSIGLFSSGNTISKEILLEIALGCSYMEDISFLTFFIYGTCSITYICILFSNIYSFSIMSDCFLGEFSGSRSYFISIFSAVVNIPLFLLSAPLFILCFFSIFSGYVFSDLFLDDGSSFTSTDLQSLYTKEYQSFYSYSLYSFSYFNIIGSSLYNLYLPSEPSLFSFYSPLININLSMLDTFFFYYTLTEDLDFLQTCSNGIALYAIDFFESLVDIMCTHTFFFLCFNIIFSSIISTDFSSQSFCTEDCVSTVLYGSLSRTFLVTCIVRIYGFCFEVAYHFFENGIVEFILNTPILFFLKISTNVYFRFVTGYLYHITGLPVIFMISCLYISFT